MKTTFLTAVVMMVSSAAIFGQASEVSLKDNLAVLKQENKDIRRKEAIDKRGIHRSGEMQVSDLSLRNFNSDFPGAVIISTGRLPGYDKIQYKQHGILHDAFYDQNSVLIGTVTNKRFEDLPAAAQKYINTHYPGYSKQAVILYDDNESNDSGLLMYDTAFNSADNYYIELQKGKEKIALQAGMSGEVSYFSKVK